MTLPELAYLNGTRLPLVHPVKLVVPFVFLVLFWIWETRHPFFGWREGRLKHAVRNISLAVLNSAILGLLFGAVTVAIAHWTASQRYGLLNAMGLPYAVTFCLGLVLLDGWMYLWHRANHTIPVLWRFHRMHHSDNRVDVTTATRFHLGEHVVSNIIRLGFIPLLGLQIWHLVVYDLLVIAVTQFHHADITLGRLDRWLRLLIVTPDMHKIHHSRWRPETDANFSVVLSMWDRVGCSFRMRPDVHNVQFGLAEFDEPHWQSFLGMWKTPFASLGTWRASSHESDQEPEGVSRGGENVARVRKHSS